VVVVVVVFETLCYSYCKYCKSKSMNIIHKTDIGRYSGHSVGNGQSIITDCTVFHSKYALSNHVTK
jgi:hypothetical protein